MENLTSQQIEIRDLPIQGKVSVSGPVGSGKTTAAVERLLALITKGVPASSILVLTPQRTLADPYAQALSENALPPGGMVSLMTISGLARRTLSLFWPAVAGQAGFMHYDQAPIFLNLETAQYHMSHLVRPLLDEGYFGSVTIDRNRLYSQIVDNLNKAASVGFPYSEINSRLESAWAGDPSQRRVFADVQECANRFRKYCLENNLLDFSLQLEIFWNFLWPNHTLRDYLTQTYRHLIYDNPEEDTPRTHDILLDWLKDFDSALLVFDEGGGYRQFLGADVGSALRLKEACERDLPFTSSFVMSPQIASLDLAFKQVFSTTRPTGESTHSDELSQADLPTTFPANLRFFPQMIEWVANEISNLVHGEEIPPSEIVILAPFLSDSLRFSLVNRLEALNIPTRTHRPSRSLRDEPASQALLTLSALAHPSWNISPSVFDVTYAFLFCIQDMDLVRAQLLANNIYQPKERSLARFDQVQADLQERITYTFGSRYMQLRDWLEKYRQESPQTFDHFLRRLFGEILSQPGFGFHHNYDAARVAASLIDSVRNFRQVIDPTFLHLMGKNTDVGREYIQLLEEGVLAAQYLEAWIPGDQQAVLIAPAYTFLMMNQPARVQFWLDPGSNGWVERLHQPLTHPYVLSRNWQFSAQTGSRFWTDADEVAANQASLARLVSGLLHRCGSRLYLGISSLGETGYEQRSLLLKAFQGVFQLAR
jgi:superfamily I DNA/RNA helicase